MNQPNYLDAFPDNPVDTFKAFDRRIGVLERTQTQFLGLNADGSDPNQPTYLDWRTTPRNITTSTWWQFNNWDTIQQGPVPVVNGYVVPNNDGWYQIAFRTSWVASNAGRRWAALAKVDTTPPGGNANATNVIAADGANTYQYVTSFPQYLQGGTQYAMMIYQNSGGNLQCTGASLIIWPIGGIQGPAGPIGATGTQGPQGPTGPTGPPGATGPAGAQGSAGPPGSQGNTGPPGLTGPAGPQGDPGVGIPAGGGAGMSLVKQSDTDYDTYWEMVSGGGQIGPPGPEGPPGPTGPQGSQGDPGPPGPTGPQGATGATGATGTAGATGPQGAQGVPGATGPAGPKGDVGPQGDPGPEGPIGPPIQIVGTVATSGDLPTNWTADDVGKGLIAEDTGHLWIWDGTQFYDAGNITGPPGDPGATGPPGATGDPGPAGPPGPTGATGPQGPAGTSVQIQGSVPNQGSLPTGLGPADAGKGWITQDTGHLWVWNGTSWTDAGLIQGPAGTPGSRWYFQYQPYGDETLIPAPHEGDTFLYSGTYDLRIYTNGAWHDYGTIQGIQGPAGPAGPAGADGAQGPAGAPGPPGPAGSSYVGTITAPVTGTIYTIKHNLNSQHPIAQVWDAVTNGLIQAELAAADANTLWVSFNVKPPHDVYVVVATGIPPSGAAAAQFFRYYQTTAATTWTINHNLGFRPSVMVVDSTWNEIFPGNVYYQNDNSVQLTFSAAVGGEAYLS